MPIIKNIFGPTGYTLRDVEKDGEIFPVLCDIRGVLAVTREDANEVICTIQRALDRLSDEDLLHISKLHLLADTPSMFPQIYGEDDPLYLAHKARLSDAIQTKKPSKAPVSTKGFVYIIRGDQYYKIGCTEDPYKRLKPMTAHAPFPLHTLLLIPTDDMMTTERTLHKRFAAKHARGEWFNLTEEDLAAIQHDYTTIDPAALKAD